MALIIALLVVVIVTLLATTVSSHFLLSFRAVELQQRSQQAWAYLSFAEEVAMKLLANDQEEQARVDHLEEEWSVPFSYPARNNDEVVQIEGQLFDLQGRLNINQLALPVPKDNRFNVHQQRFIRLLQCLEGPSLDESEAIAITEAVVDWLDPDNLVTGHGGAETLFYTAQQSPRRAGNRLMTAPSELLWVKGVTQGLFQALEPHITVLPVENGLLNINTASVETLRSLNQNGNLQPLSKADGELFIEQREEEAWTDLSIFEHGLMAGRGIDIEGIGVSSQYFLLNAQVGLNGKEFGLSSVIQRKDNSLRIVARSQGGW
ncbi:general secretion pathway protein GspK [Motiliproteus coralliicola]|uniref:Type II secretion system protein K n=1 Tax=Motiliproteus coralliicola TaxID=2283196 RepID=A0A369WK00_9GAMM|nr:type II secretion system minor pseudopilin GspK [Motiliproteus coralliicola]RDE22368.1 general secretion pathway protein GspK [Motiliproteus coralliicola]